jgi:hypothetical protein
MRAAPRSHAQLAAALFLVLFWSACSDQPSGPAAPDDSSAPAVTQLIIERQLPGTLRLQRQMTKGLMSSPGIVGSGVALGANGLPTVVALVEHSGVAVPEGVQALVIGKVSALDWQAPPQAEPQGKPTCGKKNLPDCTDDPPTDPGPNERHPRPVPIGVSTGHPAITAGTIGARVTDGTNVWALSNNHLYADENVPRSMMPSSTPARSTGG